MLRFRKWSVHFLAFILLASLLGMAVTTGINYTLAKPQKVETMLKQSRLYDHFVAYTTDQAKKSAGDTDQSGSVSLSDTAVQAAAQSAFPPELIEKSVNTFLDSNYDWLEGKTVTPNFKIDLSAAKENFAVKVGQYVKTYTAGLPVCTPDQLTEQQHGLANGLSQDFLTATCRPSTLTPEAAGAQVTDEIRNSGDYLSNPVITASNVNPDAKDQKEPYYQKLSHLPKLHQLGVKLPYIFAVLSVVSALAVIALAPVRRKGVRKVAIVLAISGTALIVAKIFMDFIVNRVERHVFNTSHVGQLQQSLTDFGHRVESSLVKTDLLFGIGFLLLALIIFGLLYRTREQADKPPKVPPIGEPAPDTGSDQTPLVISRTPRSRPDDAIMPGSKPGEPAAGPLVEPPKPKKRRRLVQ